MRFCNSVLSDHQATGVTDLGILSLKITLWAIQFFVLQCSSLVNKHGFDLRIKLTIRLAKKTVVKKISGSSKKSNALHLVGYEN